MCWPQLEPTSSAQKLWGHWVLKGKLGGHSLFPEVGDERTVGVRYGIEGGHGEVVQGGSGAPGWSGAVVDTSHHQQFLGHRGWDDASALRGEGGWGAPAQSLSPGSPCKDCKGLADLVPSVASLHRDKRELGQGDGPVDGSGYFFRALNTQNNMSTVVPSGQKCLEPGPCMYLVCMGIIFKTLSLRDVPKTKSVISDSLMGREKR